MKKISHQIKKVMRPSMTNYELKEYRPFFTEERWEEIQKIVNNWVRPKLENGETYRTMIMNPETHISYMCEKGFEEESEYNKNYKRKAVFEQILTDEEYEKCSKYTFDTFSEQNDKRIFDAAKKIPESEWYEPVFHANDFYMSTDDFKDMWECDNDPEEDPYPDYVNGSIKCRTLNPKDLEYMVDNIFENIGGFEDWEPNIPSIPDYLKEAWNRFCEEYGEDYWEEDRKTFIVLDKN